MKKALTGITIAVAALLSMVACASPAPTMRIRNYVDYPQPFEPLNPVNTGTQGFSFALFTLTEMRCLRQILRLGSVDPRILISARGVFRHGRLVITDAWCIPGHRFSFAGMEKTLTSY